MISSIKLWLWCAVTVSSPIILRLLYGSRRFSGLIVRRRRGWGQVRRRRSFIMNVRTDVGYAHSSTRDANWDSWKKYFRFHKCWAATSHSVNFEWLEWLFGSFWNLKLINFSCKSVIGEMLMIFTLNKNILETYSTFKNSLYCSCTSLMHFQSYCEKFLEPYKINPFPSIFSFVRDIVILPPSLTFAHMS